MTQLGGLAKNSRMRTAKLAVEWQQWTAVSWRWRYRGAVLCDPLHLNWVGKLTTIKNNYLASVQLFLVHKHKIL